MGFKVSDPDLAYNAELIVENVNHLTEMGEESARLIDLLLATGIQSDRIGSSLESDKDAVLAALKELEQASAPIVGTTNTFIAQLDADDAKFD